MRSPQSFFFSKLNQAQCPLSNRGANFSPKLYRESWQESGTASAAKAVLRATCVGPSNPRWWGSETNSTERMYRFVLPLLNLDYAEDTEGSEIPLLGDPFVSVHRGCMGPCRAELDIVHGPCCSQHHPRALPVLWVSRNSSGAVPTWLPHSVWKRNPTLSYCSFWEQLLQDAH